MLPEKISNKICSLRPNEDKLTITVETHINKSYEIIRQKVYESIIQSDIRLTYNQVDKLFDMGTNPQIPSDIAEILFSMRIMPHSKATGASPKKQLMLLQQVLREFGWKML